MYSTDDEATWFNFKTCTDLSCALIYASANMCPSKCIKLYRHVWACISLHQSLSTWIRVFNLYQVFINLFNWTIIMFFQTRGKQNIYCIHIVVRSTFALCQKTSLAALHVLPRWCGRQDAWTHQFRSWRSMRNGTHQVEYWRQQPASSSYCLWYFLRCVQWREKHPFSRSTCVTQICARMRQSREVTFLSIQSLTDEFQNLCHGHLGSKVTRSLVALKHGCIRYLIMNWSLLVDRFCLCLQGALSQEMKSYCTSCDQGSF